MNPIAITCPHCQAPPGRRCTLAGYGGRATKTHAARRQTTTKEPTVPDQPITDQTIEAATRAIHDMECDTDACTGETLTTKGRYGRWARAAVAAATPHIATQARERALREAAQAIRDMPYELGDAGWNALADQAEEAGYDRQRVIRRQRDDRSFTHATIGAAYQHGYRAAAKVVDELLNALAGRPGSGPATRTAVNNGMPERRCPSPDEHGYHMWLAGSITSFCPGWHLDRERA